MKTYKLIFSNLDMKKRCEKTQGQVELSFGMIFSIILIVIFISFAFYAIQKFLEIQRVAQVGQFVDNLQSDIDKLWTGSQGSQEVEYVLPNKIEYVCLVDYSSEIRTNKDFSTELKQIYENQNIVFYPYDFGALDSMEIRHIDIQKITEAENPFCFENKKGKLKITLQKSFGDALVFVSE